MVKITLGKVKQLFQSDKIKKLASANVTPIKEKWKLSKNLTLLAELNGRVEKEYNELIIKYGKEEGEGFTINPKLENGEDNPNFLEFAEKANELLAIEEEIDIKTISIDAFPVDTDLDLPDLIALDFMIEG